MPLDFDKYNQEVKDWAKGMRTTMPGVASGMGIAHRENSPSPTASLSLIKTGFKYDTGAIEVISFRFPRQLIWTHMGAGKGRGGTKGSSWLDRYGERKHTNPKSTGKMGTGGRTAKPWFNRSMEGAAGVERLADIVAAGIGGAVVKNILANK